MRCTTRSDTRGAVAARYVYALNIVITIIYREARVRGIYVYLLDVLSYTGFSMRLLSIIKRVKPIFAPRVIVFITLYAVTATSLIGRYYANYV